MKIIKFLLIAIIFFAAGFFVGQGYNGVLVDKCSVNQVAKEPANITIVLQFADSDIKEIQNLTVSQNQTVLDLLGRVALENDLEFKTKDYGDLGLMVTQIGDKINGQENKYWQFWVNGEFAQIGAESYALAEGDRVEWRFAEDTFGQ